MMIVARWGVRTAAVVASMRGLVTVVPTAAAIATMATALAVRPHVLTVSHVLQTRRHRPPP